MNKELKYELLKLGMKYCPNLERIIEYAKKDELLLTGGIEFQGKC